MTARSPPTRAIRTIAAISAIARAMGQIEGTQDQFIDGQELLELRDVLQSGALDETQGKALQALRAAILSLDIAGASGDEDDGPAANLVGHGGMSQVK